MKGIVLAGGKGTRLYPMTKPVFKPLLPVYDKPMIYYPLSVLIQAGIRDVLIITPGGGIDPFKNLFGDGSQLGMNIQYKEQPKQRGIADAFLVGEDFIGSDSVCLVLGDNIFYGHGFKEHLKKAVGLGSGAMIFGYYVDHPEAFGVVEFDSSGKAVSIEEKPKHPKSNYIVPGLYFYDNTVVDIAKHIEPSARGELEITSVNNAYLSRGQLSVIPLNADYTWCDAGTDDSLLDAAASIRTLQKVSGRQIGCIEELAYQNGWIDKAQLMRLGEDLAKTKYGQYILSIE